MIEKLKGWTEKPFPIKLRENSKTPYLNQFDDSQLREGVIHTVPIRKTLDKELEGLLTIHEKQYSGTKYDKNFDSVV